MSLKDLSGDCHVNEEPDDFLSDDRILVTPKPTPSVDKSATPTSPDQSKGEDEEPPKTLNRWYMGQYGDPDSKYRQTLCEPFQTTVYTTRNKSIV